MEGTQSISLCATNNVDTTALGSGVVKEETPVSIFEKDNSQSG